MHTGANGKHESEKSSDERVAVLTEIKLHQEKIQLLESKKTEILNPPKKRKSPKLDNSERIIRLQKPAGGRWTRF